MLYGTREELSRREAYNQAHAAGILGDKLSYLPGEGEPIYERRADMRREPARVPQYRPRSQAQRQAQHKPKYPGRGPGRPPLHRRGPGRPPLHQGPSHRRLPPPRPVYYEPPLNPLANGYDAPLELTTKPRREGEYPPPNPHLANRTCLKIPSLVRP